MDVAKRLRAKMVELDLNESQLGKLASVPQPTINRILSGDSSSPRKSTIEPLARALGVTPDWLLFGGSDEVLPGAPSEKDYALIPQYTAKNSTGSGYLNDHVELKEGLVFKRDWLKKMSLRESNLFVIYAEGQSMEPTITDGEVILIDHGDRNPKNGKVYVLRRPEGDLSIKRLVQEFSGDWVIRSDNQDKIKYPDEQISPDAILQIEIVGRVVWRGGGM
ncbi:XRE family transcriptional regulator [Pseudomonas typographi]|uniref:XRE family transcriptional regulator n=1 Tax=Pseudomonas typographi TaxID=2715964 RepID=UPI0016835996|nr:LexA family transcriptional regulator [Pseudomonas typographi]MBD1555194.1 LexA family transcriptional regulator [Pseudomonas typographi]